MAADLACVLPPAQVITTGEGGMLTTTEADWAARARAPGARMNVSADGPARHGAAPAGGLSRDRLQLPDDGPAGRGRIPASSELLTEILAERRRRLAERYTAAIERMDGLEPPHQPAYAERTWQSYAVTIADGALIDRTELMRHLLLDGVPTRRGVMAIHEEGAYAGRAADLPHTEAASRRSFMLPLFAGLTDEQQDHVIGCLASHLAAVAA